MSEPKRGWRGALWAVGLVWLCLAGACGRKPTPEVAARVGGHRILARDVVAEAERRAGAGRPVPEPAALLDEMVEQQILFMGAVEAGLDRDPEILDAYRRLLIGAFKERELVPRIEQVAVTDAEVRAYYEAHAERYTRPARLHLAALALKRSRSASAEKTAGLRARMEAARQAALALPASEHGFGALAIKYSEDQASRYRGGDIGWVEPGRGKPGWHPAAMAAGCALAETGSVSDIVTTPDAFYLLKLLGRREPEPVALAAVEPAIRQQLLREKRRAQEAAFVESLRASAEVEIDPGVLASVAARIPAREGVDDRVPPPSFP
jgi:hypothetical protein